MFALLGWIAGFVGAAVIVAVLTLVVRWAMYLWRVFRTWSR